MRKLGINLRCAGPKPMTNHCDYLYQAFTCTNTHLLTPVHYTLQLNIGLGSPTITEGMMNN